MFYDVVSIETVTGENDLTNEAFCMWDDRSNDREFSLSVKTDAIIIFNERSGKIKSGQEYLHYTFVDIETGEMMTLNCSFNMDLVVRRNNIYPENIKQAIVAYEFNKL